MHFNHLGLPVRDEWRSQRFYSVYLGFDPATAQEYEDGTVIIRNADGFDLALHPVGRVEPSPAFLHAGFKAAELTPSGMCGRFRLLPTLAARPVVSAGNGLLAQLGGSEESGS